MRKYSFAISEPALPEDRLYSLEIEAEPVLLVRTVAAAFGATIQMILANRVRLRILRSRTPDLIHALASAGVRIYQVTPIDRE